MTEGQRSAIQRAITRFENAVHAQSICHGAWERATYGPEVDRSRECLKALIERYAK